MAKSNVGILEAIDIAMQAEKKANQFYLDAVNKTGNQRGKNLLKQLADFEQTHYAKLNELKTSLEKAGKYIEYKGTAFKPFIGEAASEVSAKIEPNKDDILNILTLAINAEMKAHQHYKNMAEQTTDKRGKDMFLKLADEETMHRRILSDEFYQISNQGGVWTWGD